ncbi:MAG: class I SAM-dependent methyltransferase [Candidatus Alcyoniella australis]|nr:class I SAM-dependent methyltransferase [Candidatus Alcyoniella australis]
MANLIDLIGRLRQIAPASAADAVRRIAARRARPSPFEVAYRLPWGDARFGRRMVEVHLDQSTDRGTRKMERLLAEAHWIAHMAQIGQGSRVFEPACGPGLYLRQWARSGAAVFGADINRAALRYAAGLFDGLPRPCLMLADVQRIGLAANSLDCICYTYGEPSTWPPDELSQLVERFASWLRPGGTLILECCSDHGLRSDAGAFCDIVPRSVFCASPQVYCEELSWHRQSRSRLDRYWIIELPSGKLSEYSLAHRAYGPDELRAMLAHAGLEPRQVYGNLRGAQWTKMSDWTMAVAVRH